MDGELPRREGVSGFKPLVPQDGPPYHAERFSKATGLVELAEDYTFFAHGLLFTHGFWPRDPVRDYIAEVDHGCCPFVVTLPRPAFRGLAVGGNAAWNSVILAVLKGQWEGLYKFLSGLAGVDRDQKTFHRMLVQKIPMADVMALEHVAVLPSPVPVVEVVLFGLDGNRALVGYEPALSPPVDRITVKIWPPDPETVKLAEGVLGGAALPFQPLETPLATALRDMAAKSGKVHHNGRPLQ